MGAVRRGQLGLHDAGLFADPDLVQEHRGGACAGTDQLGQRDGLLLAGDLHRDRCGGAAGAGAGRAGGPQGQKKDLLHLRGGAGHDLLRADGLCVELAAVPDPVCGDQDLLQRVADDLRFDAGRHHDGGPHGRGLLQRLCVGIPGVVRPVFDRADRLCAGAGHGRADSRAALARHRRVCHGGMVADGDGAAAARLHAKELFLRRERVGGRGVPQNLRHASPHRTARQKGAVLPDRVLSLHRRRGHDHRQLHQHRHRPEPQHRGAGDLPAGDAGGGLWRIAGVCEALEEIHHRAADPGVHRGLLLRMPVRADAEKPAALCDSGLRRGMLPGVDPVALPLLLL